jgi:hypothetical protein
MRWKPVTVARSPCPRRLVDLGGECDFLTVLNAHSFQSFTQRSRRMMFPLPTRGKERALTSVSIYHAAKLNFGKSLDLGTVLYARFED